MKEKMLMMIFNMMLKQLNADNVKKWIDAGLDQLEDSINNDGVDDWRDSVLLPTITLARNIFSIPDND